MLNVLTKNIPWRTMDVSSSRDIGDFHKEPIRVSFWFDGTVYHPLVETVNGYGEATSGTLLASNAKLIQAVLHAEGWVSANCADSRKPPNYYGELVQ